MSTCHSGQRQSRDKVYRIHDSHCESDWLAYCRKQRIDCQGCQGKQSIKNRRLTSPTQSLTASPLPAALKHCMYAEVQYLLRRIGIRGTDGIHTSLFLRLAAPPELMVPQGLQLCTQWPTTMKHLLVNSRVRSVKSKQPSHWPATAHHTRKHCQKRLPDSENART